MNKIMQTRRLRLVVALATLTLAFPLSLPAQPTPAQLDRVAKLVEDGQTDAAKATVETLLEIHPGDPQLLAIKKLLEKPVTKDPAKDDESYFTTVKENADIFNKIVSLAEAGNTQAQIYAYRLSRDFKDRIEFNRHFNDYFKTNGRSINFDHYRRMASDADDAEAMFQDAYWNRDQKYNALALVAKSAKAGYAPAMRHLGESYLGEYTSTIRDNGPKIDLNEAVKWIREASKRNDRHAFYRMGTFYENGLYEKKTVTRTYSNLPSITTTENGNPIIIPNIKTAIDLYKRGASLGSSLSARCLAKIYEEGRPGIPKDASEALNWTIREQTLRSDEDKNAFGTIVKKTNEEFNHALKQALMLLENGEK